jgi:5-dehydro-2-deoxygluconokinase
VGGPLIYAMGRAIVDLYAEQINVTLPEVKTFRKYVGGSSANTAVGMARMGNRVGLIARVGSDPMAEYIIHQLAAEGVDVNMVQQDPAVDTGLAFAALFPPGDSKVWFCGVPNANGHLSLEGFSLEMFDRVRVVVVAGTIFAQEPGRSTALKLLEMARQQNVVVVLDVDWRPMFWPRKDEVDAVLSMALQRTTVVLANEPELELVGHTSDPVAASERLLNQGVSEVVAKRGDEGSWYFTRSETVHVPAFEVSVMNTLGAGDAFAAGYIHGYVAGWPPKRRLEWANACGAIVVTRHSCSEAMPTLEEVQQFLDGKSGEVKQSV